MYIKSIVIDGFKSYAQRTEISGFDPTFNAITGLNGSGKSNILDAICFVLGISNLSQVRATNLQELVYKNGQAGIAKATVSITFDNSDKKSSPVGYEQFTELTVTRQVVVGGRNKYLINGSNANNTRVQDMFRTVQLNVNNPHFLIMQGRITKVLNMKPPEILSMLEEAAGTKLYESKKEAAQKTIEKKDAKLNEIDNLLKEEISPTLQRLQKERASYLEYQKIIRELEHLQKLCTAYRFHTAQITKQQSRSDLATTEDVLTKLSDRCQEIETKVRENLAKSTELERRRDKDEGGILTKLEAVVTEREKVETKAVSDVTHKKDSIKAEKKRIHELTKQKASDEKSLASRQQDLTHLLEEFDKLQAIGTADQEKFEKAQAHYRAVTAGLVTTEDGQDASLNGQLMAAKTEMTDIDTQTKATENRLKHNKQEIKKKEAELKKTEASYSKDDKVYQLAKNEIARIQTELSKINYEDGQVEALERRRLDLEVEVAKAKERVEHMEAGFPNLTFKYTDPERGFNRRKVYGVVAELVQVKDPKSIVAEESVAGGKLFNIVVDTEQTGKKLLEKGQLKRRYTFIPLNKIAASVIGPDVVKRAESLVGKGNVHTALSLVSFEGELEPAMRYVFGGAFVCKDMNIAKLVTYDDRIKKKSVTLEGDSCDPAGTLSGGSNKQGGSVLQQLSQLQALNSDYNNKFNELQQLQQQLHGLQNVSTRFGQLREQQEQKENEVANLQRRLQQSSHGQQLADLEEMKRVIEEDEQTMATARERRKKAEAKVKDIEYKIKNASSIREAELKNAEALCAAAEKALNLSSQNAKKKEQEVEAARLEIQQFQEELNDYENKIGKIEEDIAVLEQELQELTDVAEECKKNVASAKGELVAKQDKVQAFNKEVETYWVQGKELSKELSASELKKKELENKMLKAKKDSKDAAKLVDDLLQSYDWIAEEMKHFGQPGTPYDFDTNDPKQAHKRIQKLEEMRDKLAKSVNMRAMNLLGRTEERFNELMKKRKIVLEDKEKITAVIRELDEKKNEALRKAHLIVNKDFGTIYSMLLPGTQAKLVPISTQSVLTGLEVKVAFGDVWQESLQVLSGGQRSLVALSLILSLLRYHPAPLYILDEVDAALDLSHTQNIGQIIKTHFSTSQFIVVSLKEGMFDNANVLFKTKFVDGVSTVTRNTKKQLEQSNSGASSHKKKK